MPAESASNRALDIFESANGILRASQARKLGIHPRTLHQLEADGAIERLSRGLYRLTELPPLKDPDLVTVAFRVPASVVCLISALHLHGLTTEIPHEVMIALPRGTKTPELHYPPIRVFRFATAAFEAGVEVHRIDGTAVRVYSAAKTVADCFKFRNTVGTPIAVESLGVGLEGGHFRPQEVLRYARICRVDRLIQPYLEALL